MLGKGGMCVAIELQMRTIYGSVVPWFHAVWIQWEAPFLEWIWGKADSGLGIRDAIEHSEVDTVVACGGELPKKLEDSIILCARSSCL
jgi:hypothetical protein